MSMYEWVIEQDSSDGVTTRIVFDFADDGSDNDNDSPHISGSRHHGASSSRHRSRGGRGGRGLSSSQQQQLHAGSGSVSGSAFFTFRDSAATRSEGGSSKRSSKRSNGSRSRRPHRQLGSSSNDGTTSTHDGSMLASSGSAYTSAALRQRYHRMLFGERSGSSSSALARSVSASRIDPSSGDAVSAVRFPRRPDVSTHEGTSSAPSTIFMSTYGAEPVEDEQEEGSSYSYPHRHSRASTNSSSSGGGGEGNGTVHNSNVAASAPWAACTSGTAPFTSHTAGNALGEEADADVERVSRDCESPARPSSHLSDTAPQDYVDDRNRYCHYVRRDVWASRATGPRTVTSSESAFPAFPPLHPISFEEDEEKGGERNRQGDRNGGAIRSRRGTHPKPVLQWPSGEHASTAQQRPPPPLPPPPPTRDVFGVSSTGRFAAATTAAPLVEATAAAAASREESRRYNKMLLRKERQKRGGRGWPAPPAAAAAVGSSSVTASGEQGYRGMQSSRSRRGDRASADVDDVSTSPTESDDADVEAASDASSLECLSNASSDEDSDAEVLRADLSFAARVQSLAHRAGRERRKMEAREERQLQHELALCEEALFTPPMAPMLGAPLSPTPPVLSLAAALRQRDAESGATAAASAFSPGGQQQQQQQRRPRGAPTASSSSFFISPIHQSVAADSSAWASGPGYHFLGMGGMEGGSGGAAGRALDSGAPRSNKSGNGGGALSRRRVRSDDNEEEQRADECEVEDVVVVVPTHMQTSEGGASVSAKASLSKSQARRARKQRKKGDVAQQCVVANCGGSRALRPIAAPSLEPPLELLPCSKKEMCEGMLDSFLMTAVLEDDDFKLA